MCIINIIMRQKINVLLRVLLNIVTEILDTRSNTARDSFPDISPLVQNPHLPARATISARSSNSSLIPNLDVGTQTTQFVYFLIGQLDLV